MSTQPITRNNSETSGSLIDSIKQIVMAAAFVLIIWVVFIFFELLYKYINRMNINRTVLLPDTYVMDNKSINISQNPNFKDSKPVNLSENERTGIEFSYSFYMQINPSSFKSDAGLYHIFHKGYSTQFPLLSPGVYLHSNKNTMRVYMNTYKTWNNYIDIDNIPVNKWFHTVVMCKQNALEVYINGNIASKLSFKDFLPYQNFEDICCFSQRNFTLKTINIPSLDPNFNSTVSPNNASDCNAASANIDPNNMTVFGAAKGMLSRLTYFNYALSYVEINQLMNEGPSSKMDASAVATIQPYLSDTWWSRGY